MISDNLNGFMIFMKLVRTQDFHEQGPLFYPLNLKIFFFKEAADKNQSFADGPLEYAINLANHTCFGNFCSLVF